MLKDAPILLIDEATRALDSEIEADLYARLWAHQSGGFLGDEMDAAANSAQRVASRGRGARARPLPR